MTQLSPEEIDALETQVRAATGFTAMRDCRFVVASGGMGYLPPNTASKRTGGK